MTLLFIGSLCIASLKASRAVASSTPAISNIYASIHSDGPVTIFDYNFRSGKQFVWILTAHPGDIGMRRLADLILAKFE